MPPPKRSAPRRTAAAIGDDLGQVRWVGGIWRAREAELSATLDFLSLIGVAADEDPIARARDLLISFVRRGCERYGGQNLHDGTARAAAASLQTLLLRSASDRQKVKRIRMDAAHAAGHSISPDAVRHREDKIMNEIAQDVFTDLQSRRTDEPQSIEAAIHRIVPIAADLRQQLHDGLCLIYGNVQPADPRERRVIEGFYRQAVVKLGDLLVASQNLAALGRKTPNLTDDDFYFVTRAHHINHFILDERGDRQFMLDFMRADQSKSWEETVHTLRATERGESLYGRWLEWVHSCYPTCAFERAASTEHMCSPHALVTLLYEVEIKYNELGLTELDIPGNEPLLHHRVRRPDGQAQEGS